MPGLGGRKSGDKASSKAVGRNVRWHQRPTVRTIRRRVEAEANPSRTERDERDNEETLLPEREAIHLGGLVLTEAFTPSTVSSLYRAFERMPSDRPKETIERLEQLRKSRSGLRGGWQNLGLVRRPGKLVMGGGFHDPDLPAGIDGVWLHVSYITPSLAMIVATFTLEEHAGDLSDLLRAEYRSRNFDAYVRIYGRLPRLRARLPWSRPAKHAEGYSMSSVEDEKRRACEALIVEHEAACSRWFFATFPGRFAAAPVRDRPTIRMLFTTEQVPYAERLPWLRPLGLDFALPLWRSTEPEGWWLTTERFPSDQRYLTTIAARRRDAARNGPGDESEEERRSLWLLTQSFGRDQASFAALHAMPPLLSVYADRLGSLRDTAAVKSFPRRPVRYARVLDKFLVGDGLDAATVTSDLRALTDDLDEFRWGVAEFEESREHLPNHPLGAELHKADEYVPLLCSAVRERAFRLARDMATTSGNIKASAELRQEIANTRLQRFILVLAVVAAAIALVSLLSDQRAGGPPGRTTGFPVSVPSTTSGPTTSSRRAFPATGRGVARGTARTKRHARSSR